ncbi:cytochrome P450 [Xylaria arbuscula]|nr:cytochrome P450 [Xylaria arbuscula]
MARLSLPFSGRSYAVCRVIYLLSFHPLAHFPGPRLAAISNIWYAYHRQYGPVVKIALNELVSFTPQTFKDIYSSHHKNIETFVKTDFQNQDLYRHREVARRLSPAFSNRFMRSMEPLLHKYVDCFVARMGQLGLDGVELVKWTSWLAMDLSAGLAWNAKMHQMRDMKHSLHLDVLLHFNKFASVLQVFKRFPLLTLFQLFSAMDAATRESVMRRIDQRGNPEHEDYFDHILPANSPLPTDERELLHIGFDALKVMFAGWGPMGDLFYGTLALLFREPTCYEILVKEIRAHFEDYDAITPASLSSLPRKYKLRILSSDNDG